MNIVTERLHLRPLETSDLSDLVSLYGNATVMKYFPAPLSEEQCKQHIEKQQAHQAKESFSMLCARGRSHDELVGVVGLQRVDMKVWCAPCVEIGWILHQDYWRKGLATEAAQALLAHAFHSLKLEEIYAFTSTLNTPSEVLMQRLGMEYVGMFDHPRVELGHSLRPHVVYRITADEFCEST